MKYLVMVQGSQAEYDAMEGKGSQAAPTWSEAEIQAMFAFMGSINNDLTASGELVDAQGLSAPAEGLAVTADGSGKPVVTKAPFGDTEEVMAGYWLLECASPERATEIAARVHTCPVPEGAANPPVIVRPIPDFEGGDA